MGTTPRHESPHAIRERLVEDMASFLGEAVEDLLDLGVHTSTVLAVADLRRSVELLGTVGEPLGSALRREPHGRLRVVSTRP